MTHLDPAKFGPSKLAIDAKTHLRMHHLKATPSRLAILEIFAKADQPLAAQSVIDIVAGRIDRVTVYRAIKSLQQNGIIKPIDLRHNHAHYELVGLKEHHHIICLRCGRIEDVKHCNLKEMQTAVLRASKHFDSVSEHALEFYGACKTCSIKGRKGVPPTIPDEKIVF